MLKSTLLINLKKCPEVSQRLVGTSGSAGGTGPSLKCNGELSKITSKVGLITADELALAGYAAGTGNTTTYLQENATATDTWWWSLSPSIFDGVTANIWFIHGESGTLNTDYYSSDFVIRPAISLISSIEVTGSGTSENPYKVV